MKAFIHELLGCVDGGVGKMNEGVLGVTKAYYGCVEAQGRGTLHCHMMIWIEGGLNPKELQQRLCSPGSEEFGQRLIQYLDEVISTNVPYADEGDHVKGTEEDNEQFRRDDLRHLVEKNQRHKHTATCYKYCKVGEHVCRFDLDEANVTPESSIDYETGELTLRILDGLINNYNATILEAMRCNMDIQFIGTGGEAKAVLYYITDYITKSPLKAHVAYAALETAMKKLSSGDANHDLAQTEKSRRLLQKTAFSILANQELSAQQVASYLLDFEDHFTSHRFANLYWRSFENYIDHFYPIEQNRAIVSDVAEDEARNSDDSAPHEHEGTSFVEYDEVRIGTDVTGAIVELSSQLTDYINRGEALEDTCLWNFVACTRKVLKIRLGKRTNSMLDLIVTILLRTCVDVKRYRF
ncbi:hypothetical protein FKP32DRAFT_1614245 [Trametes sanguinea]|nr:hypothetical protein FKP32DRAFT_1614245 [Trametes sanguinea]